MSSSFAKFVVAGLLLAGSSASLAQDIRYSWFEIAFVQQEIDRAGLLADIQLGQTVDVSTTDGSGTKFRGSVGTWNNLFAFVDFSSTDIDVSALVTNSQGQFPAVDEFDFTAARGGVGVKWALTPAIDVYGAVSYDSLDLDFGSFAGENFDVGDKAVGGAIGIRALFGNKLELRARARYTGVGDADLSTGTVDDDTLFGAGFGYQILKGLSITGDYESGEFSSWNIGFRLDLDED